MKFCAQAFFIFLLAFHSAGLFAFSFCEQHFLPFNEAGNRVNQEFVQKLTSNLQEMKVPAFYRRIGERNVPVILLNNETYPKLAPLMEESYSHVLNLTGHGNDHGMLLIGARDLSHRTVFMRNGGKARDEIHVGLHDTYVEVLDFAKTVEKSRGTYLVFSYKLTAAEKEVFNRYSVARRSGLFHVPSGFDPSEPIPGAFMKLCVSGEKCFDYMAGTGTHKEQVEAMKHLLWKLTGKDADEFLALEEVVRLRNMIKDHLNQFDLAHYASSDLSRPWGLEQMAKDLHPRMLERPEFMRVLDALAPEELGREERIRVLNLLAGHDALNDFSIATKRAGLDKYEVWPDHIEGNDRLSAIYVVHTQKVEATAGNYNEKVVERFFSGEYENTFGVGKHHLGGHLEWHSPLRP